MNIRELVLRDYAHGVRVAEDMARRFAAGTPERERWHMVAETYRQLVSPTAEQHGPASLRQAAPQQGL